MPSVSRGASSLPPEIWRMVAEQVSARKGLVVLMFRPTLRFWLVLINEEDFADWRHCSYQASQSFKHWSEFVVPFETSFNHSYTHNSGSYWINGTLGTWKNQMFLKPLDTQKNLRSFLKDWRMSKLWCTKPTRTKDMLPSSQGLSEQCRIFALSDGLTAAWMSGATHLFYCRTGSCSRRWKAPQTSESWPSNIVL
jgi:hypothetical protein